MPRFANREEYDAWRASQASSAPGTAPTVESAAPPPTFPPTAAPAKPKQGLKEAFSGLPPWAWLFVAGCLALPIVNLGGAIPGALGFGGAAGCASVAKKAEWDTAPRVLVCALITGGVWVLFFGLAVAVVALRN